MDKGSGLRLRNFLYLAVELRRGCLVEARFLAQPEKPDGLKQAQGTEGIRVSRIFRCFKGYLNVALRGEVIDLVRLRFLHDADEVGRIRHVAIVQMQLHITVVRVLIEMIDPSCVERRRPSLDAVNRIAFLEQQFCEIGAVLASNPGDESCFCIGLFCLNPVPLELLQEAMRTEFHFCGASDWQCWQPVGHSLASDRHLNSHRRFRRYSRFQNQKKENPDLRVL